MVAVFYKEEPSDPRHPLGSLFWCKPSHSKQTLQNCRLPLENVLKVYLGKVTKVFSDMAASGAVGSRCTSSRCISLYCELWLIFRPVFRRFAARPAAGHRSGGQQRSVSRVPPLHSLPRCFIQFLLPQGMAARPRRCVLDPGPQGGLATVGAPRCCLKCLAADMLRGAERAASLRATWSRLPRLSPARRLASSACSNSGRKVIGLESLPRLFCWR